MRIAGLTVEYVPASLCSARRMNRVLEGFVGCWTGLGPRALKVSSRDVNADGNLARVGRVGSVSTRREDKKNVFAWWLLLPGASKIWWMQQLALRDEHGRVGKSVDRPMRTFSLMLLA